MKKIRIQLVKKKKRRKKKEKTEISESEKKNFNIQEDAKEIKSLNISSSLSTSDILINKIKDINNNIEPEQKNEPDKKDDYEELIANIKKEYEIKLIQKDKMILDYRNKCEKLEEKLFNVQNDLLEKTKIVKQCEFNFIRQMSSS